MLTFASPHKRDIKHNRTAIDKAINLFDFCSIVDFNTGLARTLARFKQ